MPGSGPRIGLAVMAFCVYRQAPRGFHETAHERALRDAVPTGSIRKTLTQGRDGEIDGSSPRVFVYPKHNINRRVSTQVKIDQGLER
jgi:hypothetical protein